MVIELASGDFVEHPARGLGKVIYAQADEVRVYFKGKHAPRPEDRVIRFPLPNDFLVRVEYRPDTELDNLPPWTNERRHFERFTTKLNMEAAKSRFHKSFTKGFDDPEYARRERAYKASAHQRYENTFRPHAREWARQRDASKLVAGLQAVYGDSSAAKGGPEERLNLLYQPVEQPAYFEALEHAGEPLFRYVNAALDFIDSITPSTFDAFVAGLLGLPTRPGGAHLNHWTTLTWLPFIARPDEHFFIKPTITQTFASLLPFDVRYRPDLNYQTYELALKMARHLRDDLQVSALNLSGRHLDMIDVQSFMWVVMRYTEPALLSSPD